MAAGGTRSDHRKTVGPAGTASDRFLCRKNNDERSDRARKTATRPSARWRARWYNIDLTDSYVVILTFQLLGLTSGARFSPGGKEIFEAEKDSKGILGFFTSSSSASKQQPKKKPPPKTKKPATRTTKRKGGK